MDHFNFFKTVGRKAVAASVAALALMASPAVAEYPDSPITMIIGFPAGGGTDLQGRSLAAEMQEILGEPVVVVNQPGAASMIAADTAAKARADGHTLWYGSIGTLILANQLGRTKLDYFEDFQLVGIVSELIAAVAVPASSPFQTVADVIAAAHERPGELRWANNGTGAAFAAMGQGFISANKLDVVGIPFRGAGGVRQAIMSAQVDFGITNAGENLRSSGGEIRLLGALTSQSDQVLDENVQTLTDLGVPFVEVGSPAALLAPKGTSQEIMDALTAALAKAVVQESYLTRMGDQGVPVAYLAPNDGNERAKSIHGAVLSILDDLSK